MRRSGGSGGKTLLDDLNVVDVFSQMIIFDQRWVESAEEASAGAELVVEAILEDLQVFF